MTPAKTVVAAALTVALSCALPVAAESFASSASSASITASVGSVSTSFGKSSDSATKTAAADGDYLIVAIDAAAERPGTLRLTLQARADHSADSEFYLYLPQAVAERAQLAQGGTVTARARPYGTEFTQRTETQANRAFFLVLADETYRELQARAVQL